jgi:RNA polymerase sigma-70 factor, ECF subfamily
MKGDDSFADGIVDALPALGRYARHLAGREYEDLVQITALRALSRRDRYREEGKLEGWLICMMHNVWVRAGKKEAGRLAARTYDILDTTLPDQESYILAGEVSSYVKTMPPYQRRAITACVLGETPAGRCNAYKGRNRIRQFLS